MSKDKYVIKQIINRKPAPMPIGELKEDGMFLSIHENMISQIVEAKNNREFEFVCSQIQNFIEENNIGVCFAINKNELTDCLQEHQMLKLKIADLEAKLTENEKERELDNSFWKQECDRLQKALAEKKQEIESLKDNCNILCDYLGNCVVKYDEEDINGIYSEVLEKANKLKKYDTSIAKTQNQKALEQLKKVKEFFLEEHRDEEMDTDYIITKDAGQIADYLLDQIKLLKEVQNV